MGFQLRPQQFEEGFDVPEVVPRARSPPQEAQRLKGRSFRPRPRSLMRV